MLEKDDYIVITEASNGFVVTKNNDILDGDDESGVHVFNKITDLLDHVGTMLRPVASEETSEMPEHLDS